MPRIALSACSRASLTLRRIRLEDISCLTPFPTWLLGRLQLRRPRSPAQDRTACGGGFVETAARSQPGSRMKARGIAGAGRGGERLQYRRKLVERGLALGL